MKKELFFDFGRSFINAENINTVFLENFPEEEKWSPLLVGELYKHGNVVFTNDVPWIDHLNNVPPLPREELADIIKSAAETSGAAIAVTGTKSALISAKAGIDFFKQNQAPEIIFLDADSKDHKAGIKRLKKLDFYICNIGGGDSSPQERDVLDKSLKLMRKKYGDESRLLNFDIKNSAFKGAFCILSPASLFLLAVRGVNIEEIVAGAELEPMPDLSLYVPDTCGDVGIGKENLIPPSYLPAKYYSIIRSMMIKQGKSSEAIRWIDPALGAFAGWLKNLFQENPIGLSVDERLLSVTPAPAENSFETILDLKYNSSSSGDTSSTDAKNKLLLDEVSRNRYVSRSPLLRVELPDESPYSYGRLVAFFSRASHMLWK
ncbi:MAG: hypothetical protein FWG92_05230 [Leptospirales bacterium]|nr:hypothetical protein [Leptospirales bacterium]